MLHNPSQERGVRIDMTGDHCAGENAAALGQPNDGMDSNLEPRRSDRNASACCTHLSPPPLAIGIIVD